MFNLKYKLRVLLFGTFAVLCIHSVAVAQDKVYNGVILSVGDIRMLGKNDPEGKAAEKTWTQSPSGIVTITKKNNDVELKAVKAGKVVVTAKKTGLRTVIYNIEVKAGSTPPQNTSNASTTINPASVTLDRTKETLEVGKSLRLKATVNPANTSNPNVYWSSSNDKVAVVDSTGNVRAVAPGTATISVRTNVGNKQASCAITVPKTIIPVSSVKLDKTSGTVEYSKTMKLTATVSPADATDKSIRWSVDKPHIATVDQSGNVKGQIPGSATVTATTKDGPNATFSLTVTQSIIALTGIKLDKYTGNVESGKSLKLNASVIPANATNQHVTWKSGNTAIATVDSSGNVKCVNSGTTKIIATNGSNHTAAFNLIVTSPPPKKFSFGIYSYLLNSELKVPVQYDPEWFKINSTTYNHELAKISLVLANTAYKENETKNTTKVLKDLGFTFIQSQYDYDKKDIHRVAFTLAYDPTKQIIAIVLRGTPHPKEKEVAEWESNLNSQGFNTAADRVMKREPALNFVEFMKGKDVSKIWIVGHSRGAAVANILGAEITTNIKGYVSSGSANDVFVYAFATPNHTTLSEKGKYKNIFNINIKEDAVPSLPPGSHKYGIVKEFKVLTPGVIPLFTPAVSKEFKSFAGKDMNLLIGLKTYIAHHTEVYMALLLSQK